MSVGLEALSHEASKT